MFTTLFTNNRDICHDFIKLENIKYHSSVNLSVTTTLTLFFYLLQSDEKKDGDANKKMEECLTVTPLHAQAMGERRRSQVCIYSPSLTDGHTSTYSGHWGRGEGHRSVCLTHHYILGSWGRGEGHRSVFTLCHYHAGLWLRERSIVSSL